MKNKSDDDTDIDLALVDSPADPVVEHPYPRPDMTMEEAVDLAFDRVRNATHFGDDLAAKRELLDNLNTISAREGDE